MCFFLLDGPCSLSDSLEVLALKLVDSSECCWCLWCFKLSLVAKVSRNKCVSFWPSSGTHLSGSCTSVFLDHPPCNLLPSLPLAANPATHAPCQDASVVSLSYELRVVRYWSSAMNFSVSSLDGSKLSHAIMDWMALDLVTFPSLNCSTICSSSCTSALVVKPFWKCLWIVVLVLRLSTLRW